MAMIVQCRLNVISLKSMSLGSSADEIALLRAAAAAGGGCCQSPNTSQ